MCLDSLLLLRYNLSLFSFLAKMTYKSLFQQMAHTKSARLEKTAEHYVSRGFSEEQAQVISAPVESHSVVIAGPGAGKTKVLTERIRHLLHMGVPAQDILVCTFTRAAANEIKHRLADTPDCPSHIGTLHALSFKVGLPNLPSQIMTDEAASTLAFQLAQQTLPEETLLHMHPKDLYLAICRGREESYVQTLFSPLVSAFKAALEERHEKDFLYLLEAVVDGNPRKKFKHVIVDEAQDLTTLQQDWLTKVAAKDASFFMVGDDDQSIYSFRGHQGGAMNQLMQNPKTKVFHLSYNYRCSLSVIEQAGNLISHNYERWAKTIVPRDNAPLGSASIVRFNIFEDELPSIHAFFEGAKSCCVLGRTSGMLEAYQVEGLPTKTLHEAKGQEFEKVWIAGCEEMLLPHILCKDTVAEERRLFYVGMTRAIQDLRMSALSIRGPRVRNESRFLSETLTLISKPDAVVEELDF